MWTPRAEGKSGRGGGTVTATPSGGVRTWLGAATTEAATKGKVENGTSTAAPCRRNGAAQTPAGTIHRHRVTAPPQTLHPTGTSTDTRVSKDSSAVSRVLLCSGFDFNLFCRKRIRQRRLLLPLTSRLCKHPPSLKYST